MTDHSAPIDVETCTYLCKKCHRTALACEEPQLSKCGTFLCFNSIKSVITEKSSIYCSVCNTKLGIIVNDLFFIFKKRII